MKKIFTLLLIMVMTLSFAACGNDSIKNQSADGNTENELSTKAEEKAMLINICEGNPYAAMPEDDAIAYVENELALLKQTT